MEGWKIGGENEGSRGHHKRRWQNQNIKKGERRRRNGEKLHRNAIKSEKDD